MSFDPERTAAALLAARREGRPTAPLPPDLVPPDRAAGIAAQNALARMVGAVPPAGFKIGATARVMQDYLGVTSPIAGFMEHGNLFASGDAAPWDRYRRVGVECEIAVRLARDLPPGPCDEAAAADAVGAVGAAIELVENRYDGAGSDDLGPVGVPTLVADQMFHAGAVLGGWHADWRALDLLALRGTISVDSGIRGEGVGRDLLGGPLTALAWLAGSGEAAAFGGLRAGQIIMLGSVTAPIMLDRPCRVTVAFAGLKHAEFIFTATRG